jgi:hypothetical protein
MNADYTLRDYNVKVESSNGRDCRRMKGRVLYNENILSDYPPSTERALLA